jgi:hypothetical protein
MTDFRPEELLRVLHEHDVRYVLIGGLAATLYGSAAPTFDVDITPDTSQENLERLSAALTALDARIRVDGVPDGLPFAHDAKSLAGMTMLNLVTRFRGSGRGEPAGRSGRLRKLGRGCDRGRHHRPVGTGGFARRHRAIEGGGRSGQGQAPVAGPACAPRPAPAREALGRPACRGGSACRSGYDTGPAMGGRDRAPGAAARVTAKPEPHGGLVCHRCTRWASSPSLPRCDFSGNPR